MKDFTLILGELIDAIDLTIQVESVVADKVFLCKTLFLRELRIIEDEFGNEYTVTDVLNDEWITVDPIGGAPSPFTGETVICPDITYLFGSPSSTNSEYSGIEVDSGDKTPLIWLLENYTEKLFGRMSSFEREVSPRLFFMDETDEEDWSNEEHHAFSIQPMMNLADEFLLTVKKNRKFKRLEDTGMIPRARFGRYVDNRGNEKTIIDEYFSGVELQPTLIKYKETSCINC